MRAAVCVAVIACMLSVAHAADTITEKDVLAAQQKWGDAIVAIGKVYSGHGDYKALAAKTVGDLYAYDLGTVLFKPTKASAEQFRETRDQAVSYFVGGVVPEDKGFALQPWSKVRFEDQMIVFNKDSAIAMGNYYFTDAKTGKETKVEFTFGYVRDAHGDLRINVHHSSLPYSSGH